MMGTGFKKIVPLLVILAMASFTVFRKDLLAQTSFTAKFEKTNPKKTGITFKNQLKEDRANNILRYEYFYNGGGVAIGDLDNDGFEDLFLTGNMAPNKVYRNLGNWKFEDRTKASGITSRTDWATGVTMADVNGDGLLDIYVCYSGKGGPDSRRNELWINQGGFHFKNEAKQYGLDDPSNSTQALFFDFDRDGDLDMYLLNHHIQSINELEFDEVKTIRHPSAGDKLYRNDGGKFTDISEQAGIKGSALGFGLAVIASDINQDGWLDLLITNDYIEPDYLYINNGDGTFSDRLPDYFQHISHFSMGADIADINNDGLPDVYTLDMLPKDNRRQKLLYGPENYEQYSLMVRKGFYHQSMRNMLHLNRGNGLFSEIGQLAGISNTDWSWSALFFDANNDGKKDLLVTNGYYRDYTNRDFLKYKGDYYFKQAVANSPADTLHLVTSMTSTPITNYLFENNGDLTFTDRTLDWGFAEKSFSNGAAFADLDNDGDLDLVINHLNETVGVYENKGTTGNFLQLSLWQDDMNKFGIGARITLETSSGIQVQELQPVRGFQSAVTPKLHFGLGESDAAVSIRIQWPDGTLQTLEHVQLNQHLRVEKKTDPVFHTESAIMDPLLIRINSSPDFTSKAAGINDFKRQPLMVQMPSYISPVTAMGDLDSDGNPEVFLGGTKGQPGKIFSLRDSSWTEYRGFRSSDVYTDAVAVFHDFNGDGVEDLFVGSGGYHDYTSSDEGLQDRLYLNDGSGKLTLSTSFPTYAFSTGTAAVLDVNGDGAPDLFIGAKLLPGKYPQIPQSKILINDGAGNFSDKTLAYLPDEGKLGMITGAEVLDLNGDGRDDLVIVGEFLPVTFLVNQSGGRFVDESAQYLKAPLTGWWGSISKADFDGDGDDDLVLGNFGINSQFDVAPDKPLKLYAADFDQNGSIDPVFECFIGNESYPYASRDELLDQMVGMRSKFTDYSSYSTAKMERLFTAEELGNAIILEANTLKSYYLENRNEEFIATALPLEAQAFPVYAIEPMDVNGDGLMDLILGGNQSHTRIRVGALDAGLGLVMLGDGAGNFSPLLPEASGLSIKGDIKSILTIKTVHHTGLLFGVHGQQPLYYKLR